jgi:hypothetical protein
MRGDGDEIGRRPALIRGRCDRDGRRRPALDDLLKTHHLGGALDLAVWIAGQRLAHEVGVEK